MLATAGGADDAAVAVGATDAAGSGFDEGVGSGFDEGVGLGVATSGLTVGSGACCGSGGDQLALWQALAASQMPNSRCCEPRIIVVVCVVFRAPPVESRRRGRRLKERGEPGRPAPWASRRKIACSWRFFLSATTPWLRTGF